MAASKPALNGAAESWAGAANWKDLDESVVDPITLEPIADLAVAPFRLKGFLFDAEALACYLVASSRYENPLDRSALTSAECRALDGHLAAHGLRAMRVAQERVAAEKRKAKAASEAEARAAEAGKLRDAVQQLGDSESAPSTAAAVEGIDDDASFTQHIADEANASEDENPAWDSSDYSSGDFDYSVDPSTAGNSPARQRLRSGPGLGDGDVASPPARNDDDDWFAAEEPPPKKAPKEVAGYLSKFDADFERAMAKHRRHL